MADNPNDEPEERDGLEDDDFFCEELTAILTRRTACAGVLTSAGALEARLRLGSCFSSVTSLSGLLLVEVDRDLRRPVWIGPPPGVVLRRTTLLRATGLLSRTRAGDVGRDERIDALPALTWRLVSRTGLSGCWCCGW